MMPNPIPRCSANTTDMSVAIGNYGAIAVLAWSVLGALTEAGAPTRAINIEEVLS